MLELIKALLDAAAHDIELMSFSCVLKAVRFQYKEARSTKEALDFGINDHPVHFRLHVRIAVRLGNFFDEWLDGFHQTVVNLLTGIQKAKRGHNFAVEVAANLCCCGRIVKVVHVNRFFDLVSLPPLGCGECSQVQHRIPNRGHSHKINVTNNPLLKTRIFQNGTGAQKMRTLGQHIV